MKENREKVIKGFENRTETGYLDDDGKFITHSFNDEPAIIFTNSGTKMWCEDNKIHRDNNLPAVIRSNRYNSYYKNNKHYWFINNKEYHDKTEIKEKFKNKILVLPNVNNNILKENGIVDVIRLHLFDYLILDQSQYNLAILKFL